MIALALLAVMAIVVIPSVPRETRVSFRLPPELRSLDVDYRQSGELIRSARFTWSGNSPLWLRHSPELVPGRTEVEVTLRDPAGRTTIVRHRFDADPARIERIDLRP